MANPLKEFNEAAVALEDDYGWEPGWALAWFKEKEVIPQDAVCLNMMIGPGWIQVQYACENPPEHWYVVD